VDQRLSRRTAWEIYRSDGKMKSRERASVPLPAFLGIDEFQPDIPRQVGLHQSPPPLHRPASECDKLTLPVNQYWDKATEPPRSTPTARRNHQRPNRKQNFHLKISGKCPNNRDYLTQYYGSTPNPWARWPCVDAAAWIEGYSSFRFSWIV
jgi:hypothetical protein